MARAGYRIFDADTHIIRAGRAHRRNASRGRSGQSWRRWAHWSDALRPRRERHAT